VAKGARIKARLPAVLRFAVLWIIVGAPWIWPADQGPSTAPTAARQRLEESAADWGVYGEGNPVWALADAPAPSLDGHSLKCSITGGAPYSNAHFYRNLLDDGSRLFALSLAFQFLPATTLNNQGGESVIQALEFTVSAWRQGQRYEWALQWQNVGAGAPQWRYWDPSRAATERWAAPPGPIAPQFTSHQFHTLTIKGEIRNGNSRYRSFSIDGAEYSLNLDAPSVPAPGVADKLAVAVQLDGNAHATPYDVYLDRVALARSAGSDAPFPGESLVDCSSLAGWSVEWDGAMPTPTLSLSDHPEGKGVRLDYDFLVSGSNPPDWRNWAQLRYDFATPVDLSGHDMLRFHYLGGGSKNHLQVWLHDDTDNRIGIQIDRVTDIRKAAERAYYSLPYSVPSRGVGGGVLVQPAGWPLGDGTFDYTRVEKLFFAVSRDTSREPGDVRLGGLEIGRVELVDSIGRSAPAQLQAVEGNLEAAAQSVAWLVANQGLENPGANGLLTSWVEETPPLAHIYDQALALIAFTREGLDAQARALAERLVSLQAPNGAWYKYYRRNDQSPDPDGTLWEGDVAWAAYALSFHWHATGHAWAHDSAVSACSWLKSRIAARNADQDTANDASVHNSIEANIDAWFAFAFTGGFQAEADIIRGFLMTKGWDADRRRFCRGSLGVDPGNAIDVHTWGSEFLLWTGENAKALDTLSYCSESLPTGSFDGSVHGLDGQGPFSVWFEGTGQWVAAGGWGGDFCLSELNANQEEDGSLPGSPDDFHGEGVWLTHWHGVAPTAWCYFANTAPVFSQGLIRGTVFESGGAPANSGTVEVYRPGSEKAIARAAIHPDGSYVVAGLRAGEYVVRASSGRRASRVSGALEIGLARYVTLDLSLQSYSQRRSRGTGRQ